MRDYLESIIKPLLIKPEALQISETTDEMGMLLSVSIEKPDMGRIIGKGGETINAVRTLVHALGSQQNMRVSVKILEPVVGGSSNNVVFSTDNMSNTSQNA